MSKVLKLSKLINNKLENLMTALNETGCDAQEKKIAHKIFTVYLDGNVDIKNKK